MSDDSTIIRAGCKSTGFRSGSVIIDISGTFSRDEADDIVLMLGMAILAVRRQSAPGPMLQANEKVIGSTSKAPQSEEKK